MTLIEKRTKENSLTIYNPLDDMIEIQDFTSDFSDIRLRGTEITNLPQISPKDYMKLVDELSKVVKGTRKCRTTD